MFLGKNIKIMTAKETPTTSTIHCMRTSFPVRFVPPARRKIIIKMLIKKNKPAATIILMANLLILHQTTHFLILSELYNIHILPSIRLSQVSQNYRHMLKIILSLYVLVMNKIQIQKHSFS